MNKKGVVYLLVACLAFCLLTAGCANSRGERETPEVRIGGRFEIGAGKMKTF